MLNPNYKLLMAFPDDIKMFRIKRNADVEFTAWNDCRLPDPHRSNNAPLCGEERKKGGLVQVWSRSLWGRGLAADPICAHIPKLSLTPVKECERHTRVPAGAPCLQLHTDLIQP